MNKYLDFYIEQHDHCRLGNFIQTTPLIKTLYKIHSTPIPVLFQTDYVKQCYLNCKYIEIIETPRDKCLYSTKKLCPTNLQNSSHYIQELVLSYTTNDKPFIDKHTGFRKSYGKDYGVFINGSGSEDKEYLNRKLIDIDTQHYIKQISTIPIIGIGSLNDQSRNIFTGYYGDIKLALNIINDAKWIISNATGFYHAAGALNKIQLALWKHCHRPRTENLNTKCTYSAYGEWNTDIAQFLQKNL